MHLLYEDIMLRRVAGCEIITKTEEMVENEKGFHSSLKKIYSLWKI
jgi:hypothetical protein